MRIWSLGKWTILTNGYMLLCPASSKNCRRAWFEAWKCSSGCSTMSCANSGSNPSMTGRKFQSIVRQATFVQGCEPLLQNDLESRRSNGQGGRILATSWAPMGVLCQPNSLCVTPTVYERIFTKSPPPCFHWRAALAA